MQIDFKGRILKVKQKDNKCFVTFNDTEFQEGGQFQIGIPGSGKDFQVDDLIKMKAEVRPGTGQYGMYLNVTDVVSVAKGEAGK